MIHESTSFPTQIEEVTFSMKEYLDFISSIQYEISEFKKRQASGVAAEEARLVPSPAKHIEKLTDILS